MSLNTIKEMVVDTLYAYPDTRNSDDMLIATIYKNYFGIEDEAFWKVMATRSTRGIPSGRSIERARRKAVEEFPELKGTRETEEARFNRQRDYIEFAQGGSVNEVGGHRESECGDVQITY